MASSTTSPVLPVSTAQPTTSTSTSSSSSTSSPPPPPSAIRTVIVRFHTQIKDGLSQRRPWLELLDRTAFSRPDSLSDATTRLRKNYSYFRVNYLTLLSIVLVLSLFAHPFSLLTLIVLLASWCFLYLFRSSDQALILFGRSFSDKETLGLLVVLSVFVVFLTSVGSLLMSALVIGTAIVCVHGAFRIPEDLFLDDQESVGAATGFLSFLGGATKNAAVGAAAAIPPRI